MKLITPAAILTALTLATTPAFAQQQPHENHSRSADSHGGQGQGHAVERPRAQAARPAQQPRAEAPRPAPASRAEAPRAPAQQPQRTQTPRAVEQPRVTSRPSEVRRPELRQYQNRAQYQNRGQYDARVGRAVPRGNVIVRPRVERPIIVSPRYYGPHGYYSAPYYGYRPYTFRPRTHVAFGIYLGYAVPYSYAYPYPVPVYGYGSPAEPVVVGPNSSAYGGVSLEITPNNAEVYVDGADAGLVQDFDGTQEPLTLTAGSHRLEIRADGFEPLTLDVSVNPGEVLPYRGDLQHY